MAQDAFGEKALLLIINEEADKKTRKLGRVEVDLARYAQQAADKATSSFEVTEAASRDLLGDEDKKDKGGSADAMRLTLTLNFVNKAPASECVLSECECVRECECCACACAVCYGCSPPVGRRVPKLAAVIRRRARSTLVPLSALRTLHKHPHFHKHTGTRAHARAALTARTHTAS